MISKFKKVLAFTALTSVLTLPIVAQASTTVYESTYDMTGGVESKRFQVNAPGTFKVETWGKETYKTELNFTVYLKKDVTGADPVISQKDDHKSNSYESTEFNITTSRGSGTYYAYLRNFTGQQMRGDITITVKD